MSHIMKKQYLWLLKKWSVVKILEKTYADAVVGNVTLRRKAGVRRFSIRVSERTGVSVTVPYMVSFERALEFFLSNREWVLKTISRQREHPGREATAEEIAALRQKAASYLPERLAQLGHKYGFTWNRISLKHNRTNWGSCSRGNNINLNISLMELPQVLIDYVILHELCHLVHHNHSQEFHRLLESLLTDHLGGLPSDIPYREAQFPLDHSLSRALRQYRPV